MNSDYYFISYSRRDFYMAESLSQFLKEQGISYWIDNEQLEVGVDWRLDIENGIQNARGLILITSRASLASPYVAMEWARAIEHKKPVILFIVEEGQYSEKPYQFEAGKDSSFSASMLPEIAISRIDARSNFKKAYAQLLEVLKWESSEEKNTESPPKLPLANIPSPAYLNIPRKLPADLWYLFLILAFMFIDIVAMTFYTMTLSIQTFLISLYFVYSFGRFIFNFLRRDFKYWQLLWNIIFCPLVLLFFAPNIFLKLFPFLLALVALWIVVSSKHLLLWLPKGQAPHFLRYGIGRGIKKIFFSSPKQEKQEGIRFQLDYHPADSKVAEEIRTVFINMGHQESTESIDAYRISLISHLTDPKASKITAIPEHKTIHVLVGRIADESYFRDFQNRQWVDYRSRSKALLRRMALELLPKKEKMIQDLSVFSIPEGFNKLVVPSAIALIGFLLYSFGLFWVLFAGLFARVTIDIRGAAIDNIIFAFLGLFVIVLPIFFSYFLIQSNVLLVNRDISFRQFITQRFLLISAPIFAFAVFTFNFFVLGFLLLFVIFAFFVLRPWLIAQPIKKPLLSSFQHNSAYWRDNLLHYALAFLIVMVLISGFDTFNTSYVDEDELASVGSQEHILSETLSLNIPNVWYTSFVRDELEVASFNRETLNLSILSALIYSSVDTEEVSAYYESFLLQKEMSSHVTPLWIAIFDPRSSSAEFFISVWTVSEAYEAESIFRDYLDYLQAQSLNTEVQSNYFRIVQTENIDSSRQFYISDDYVVIVEASDEAGTYLDYWLPEFLSAFGISEQ